MDATETHCAHGRHYEREWCAVCGFTPKTAELSDVERDARRYRYLRERDLDTIRTGGIFAGRVPQNVVVNGDDLDAAIDEAIRNAVR